MKKHALKTCVSLSDARGARGLGMGVRMLGPSALLCVSLGCQEIDLHCEDVRGGALVPVPGTGCWVPGTSYVHVVKDSL